MTSNLLLEIGLPSEQPEGQGIQASKAAFSAEQAKTPQHIGCEQDPIEINAEYSGCRRISRRTHGDGHFSLPP
jgi:hypothetical protein